MSRIPDRIGSRLELSSYATYAPIAGTLGPEGGMVFIGVSHAPANEFLKPGAESFLDKAMRFDELVEALRRVAAGNP